MTRVRAVAIVTVAFVLGAPPLLAQELSRYRGYALGSSVASVVKISAARETDTRTLHERPAKIQEFAWRAPYLRAAGAMADPVRDVLFSFYDDQLYQMVITYDHDRMEGLTNDDVIERISATYGLPLLQDTRATPSALPGGVSASPAVVAQWDDAASLLTLTRGAYSSELQLVLISKTLNSRALSAIKEALRLDTQEAPQRERDQRSKKVADAGVANQKARLVNRAAFRP